MGPARQRKHTLRETLREIVVAVYWPLAGLLGSLLALLYLYCMGDL